jgi:hypothetical protein
MVCYAPSTGTLALIGVGIYIFWHRTVGHFLGLFGTVLEIAVILGVEVAAGIALVWLTRSIRRRRAAAGACTTCRFRCQQALAARPNLLVNRVDRRLPVPARPELTCHPAAPLLPGRLTAAARRLRPALPIPRPAVLSAAAGHDPARFMGPVPAPFSVRGPVHPRVSPLPPSATRVSSPTPAPVPEPEAADADGYVLSVT